MSTGVEAMKMPERPPITNIETNASAFSIGVVKRMLPPQSVPSQLKILIADGTAMTIVEIMKVVPSVGFMPLWNMWWPHTIKPRNAMPSDRVDHRAVAEDRLAREDGEDVGDDAHRRQDHDVDLGVPEEPEEVLPEERLTAAGVRQGLPEITSPAGRKKVVPSMRSKSSMISAPDEHRDREQQRGST